MRKLPNGISNYEKIIEENRIYVDKTMYIEKMEDLADSTIMFLRPRKFGKTLFTSTLECYYDKNKTDKFEELFGKTYIGKNPTPNKNRYCILRFNFSGISTNTVEETMKGFREKVDLGINRFVADYEIEFYNNPEQSTEGILGSIFEAFRTQRRDEKIYVIIDEYDHFANELLGFKTDEFKELVAKNGKVRKWYEILKEGTESVVDRIFITGVAPITLDSTTSGFNIANDITKDIEFNEAEFEHKLLELKEIVKDFAEDNSKLSDLLLQVLDEIEQDKAKFMGQDMSVIINQMRYAAIDKEIEKFSKKWYIPFEAVKYEAYNYKDGELANENKLKELADYATYKVETSEALPKFKFNGALIKEFKEMLMPEIGSLIE